MKVLFNCVSGYNGSCLKGCRAPFGLALPWKYPPDVAVYLKGQAQLDIIGGHRILSTQNEGGPARLPVRHPLGALEGGLKGDSPGDFWVLGSYASKASSNH